MAKKINEAFFLQPWAVKEDFLRVMSDIVMRHMKGEKLSTEQIQDKIKDKTESAGYEVINGTAVIPVYGVISKRISMLQNISSPGTSAEEIKAQMKTALADSAVEKILLDIDSPGGSVGGVPELSDYIFEARKQKSVIAYASGQMCSAAYWIGSAAEKVFATKSAEIGSIGVYTVVHDYSVAEHNMGIKTDIIKAGKFKAVGHPSMPLTEEARDMIQTRIDERFDQFKEAVARNRGIKMEEVATFADGSTFLSKKAVDMGLIDGVANIEDFLDGSAAPAGKNNSHPTQKAESVFIIDNDQTKNQKKEESMELTVEVLKKEHSTVATALIEEGKAQGKQEALALMEEAKKTAAKEALDAERARVKSIFAEAPKGMEALARSCVENGTSLEAAKTQMLEEFKTAAPKTPAPAAAAETEEGTKMELSLEDKCKKEWESNEKIRQEFASLETYTGWKRAESNGRVRNAKK